MKPSETFGHRVRAIREAHGWSQGELANRLDSLPTVDNTTVGRIEKAQRRVTVDDLVEITATLGVAPIHLLVPDDGETVQVGSAEVPASDFRAWFLGERPLPGTDETNYYAGDLRRSEPKLSDQLTESIRTVVLEEVERLIRQTGAER